MKCIFCGQELTTGDYESVCLKCHNENNAKVSVPTMDYEAECDRLYKENYKQRTIIDTLIFYIQEKK